MGSVWDRRRHCGKSSWTLTFACVFDQIGSLALYKRFSTCGHTWNAVNGPPSLSYQGMLQGSSVYLDWRVSERSPWWGTCQWDHWWYRSPVCHTSCSCKSCTDPLDIDLQNSCNTSIPWSVKVSRRSLLQTMDRRRLKGINEGENSSCLTVVEI